MNNRDNPPSSPDSAAAANTSAHAVLPPCFDSSELLGNQGLAVITHQGQRYQLRQTKAGKLILTK